MAKSAAPSAAELALLREMQGSLGVQEKKGHGWSPDVKQYFLDCGWTEEEIEQQGFDDDKTAWCGARMGSALKRCGLPMLGKAASLLARNYANYGAKADPGPGRIGVVPRGTSGWEGHVFVIEKILPDGKWQTIGGNQGPSGYGKVSRAIVDPRTTKILAVRSPVPATVKDLRAAGSKAIARNDLIETVGYATAGGGTAIAAASQAMQPAAEVAVNAPSMIEPIATGAGHAVTITSAGTAIGQLFVQNPWLVMCIGAGVTLVVLARTGKLKRVRDYLRNAVLSGHLSEQPA